MQAFPQHHPSRPDHALRLPETKRLQYDERPSDVRPTLAWSSLRNSLRWGVVVLYRPGQFSSFIYLECQIIMVDLGTLGGRRLTRSISTVYVDLSRRAIPRTMDTPDKSAAT